MKISLDNDIGLSVINTIIPAIQYLHSMSPPLQFVSVLGSEVKPHLISLQLDPSFLCSDLKKSDLFFNSLKKK